MVQGNAMKKMIMLILVILFAVVIPSTAFASDISDALYKGLLNISNTGESATGVATTANISTSDYIDLGYIDSDCGNTAVQNITGADTPYMPGYGGNPWCLFVDELDDNEHITNHLYSKDATGGDIVYFPGFGGMTIPDDPSMEIGDSGSINLTDTYVDMSSVDDNLVLKEGALRAYVNDGEELSVVEREEQVGLSQAQEDGDRDLFNSDDWFGQTFTVTDSFFMLYFQFYGRIHNDSHDYTFQIRDVDGDGKPGDTVYVERSADAESDFSYNPTQWQTIPVQYDFAPGEYCAILTYPSNDSADDIEWHYKNSDVYSGGTYCESSDGGDTWSTDSGMDFTFKIYKWGEGDELLSASNIPSGEHDIEIYMYQDNSTIELRVDGDVMDAASQEGSGITDTDYDWVIGDAEATPYIGQFNIDVGGVNKCSIDWEYGATFTDDSGNGNDATPTFRIASSDADVSAGLTSFGPMSESVAPGYALSEQVDQIQITQSVTGDFSTEPSAGEFPLSNVIRDVAEASETPPQLPLIIIAGFTVLAISLTVSGIMRRYGSGGILPKTLAICAIMGIFVAIGSFGIDFWMIIVLIIIAVGLMFASKQVGWS